MFDLKKTLEELSKRSKSTQNDFDFLLGDWSIQNNIVPPPWANPSRQKRNFRSQLSVKKLIDGLGQIDIYKHEKIKASTLRLFDPETKLWSLFWFTSNVPKIQEPQVGTFEGEEGEFFGLTESEKGQEIVVKFKWSKIFSENPLWEQYLSQDSGNTWVLNWTMEFSKLQENLNYF